MRQSALITTSLLATLALSSLSCSRRENDTLIPLDSVAAVPPSVTLDLTLKNVCLDTNSTFVEMFVSNISHKIKNGALQSDTDRDGIVNLDDTDTALGLVSTERDSNGDGYSDLLVYLGGFSTAAQSSLKRCASPGQDTDQDGLTDCEEENILHTDPSNADSDGDSIPDLLEVRNGLNPVDANDAAADVDNDTLTNLEEIKLNTPPMESNTAAIKSMSYAYARSPLKASNTSSSCFDGRVTNISVPAVTGGNLIVVWLLQREGELTKVSTRRLLFDDGGRVNQLEVSYESLNEGPFE
jgi:hypothetical protein